MRQALNPNGLDVQSIAPHLGARFSPNLYMWLTEPGHRARALLSRVYQDDYSTAWIGVRNETGHFVGNKLNLVLQVGASAGMLPHTLLPNLIEDESFWSRYATLGRCAIDTSHRLSFTGDQSRWSRQGGKLSCVWCMAYAKELHPWPQA